MGDEQQRKRTRSTAFDNVDEARIFPTLETIESGSDIEDDIASSDSNTDFGDYECFYSDIQSELEEFLEDGYNYSDQEMVEEDDIDPDELSYEELIALGEMVGIESKGLSEAEISKHLSPVTCEPSNLLLVDKCVVCQVEYEQGEKLVAIPCGHPYHPECITKWLQVKKICPICSDDISSTTTAETLQHSKQ